MYPKQKREQIKVVLSILTWNAFKFKKSFLTPCALFPSKGGHQEEGVGHVAHAVTKCGIM